MMKEKLIKVLQNALAKGALEKAGTWGGPECAKAVDLKTHVIESSCFVFLGILAFYYLGCPLYLSNLKKHISKDIAHIKVSSTVRVLEILLGSVHVLMFLQLIYYKYQIFSLINLLQPCHVILLLQGIALFSTDYVGILISLFILPALTGTALAMLFPETTGLGTADSYLSIYIIPILLYTTN